jgi:hypothetical protein
MEDEAYDRHRRDHVGEARRRPSPNIGVTPRTMGRTVINPLIHYEIELATRHQDDLRRQAALWDLASRAADGRSVRPRWRRIWSAFATSMFVTATAKSWLAIRRS